MVIQGKFQHKHIYIQRIKTKILYHYVKVFPNFGGLKIESDVERLYALTDYLIKQQFYLTGKDIILGRTPDISIKVKNSGKVVSRFKNLFITNIHLFLKGKYVEFFEPFKIIKGIDDNHIKEIYQDIQIRLATMHSTDFDVTILYTIALSSLISTIREIYFNESINLLTEKLIKESSGLTKNQIQLELDKLFMRNNPNLSILYNLSFLGVLAESFNFNSVSQRCKLEKAKYSDIIKNLVLSSYKK